MQYNAIKYNTIQFNTIQYNTIQYNTMYFNTWLNPDPSQHNKTSSLNTTNTLRPHLPQGILTQTGMSWDISLKDVNAGMPRTVQDMYSFKDQSLYLIKVCVGWTTCVVLFCAVLLCAVTWCDMSCHDVVCYDMRWYVILCFTTIWYEMIYVMWCDVMWCILLLLCDVNISLDHLCVFLLHCTVAVSHHSIGSDNGHQWGWHECGCKH